MEENPTGYNFKKDFESGPWRIRSFELHNVEEYMWDINNIFMASICFVDSTEMNRFFGEACQMIANAMYLFQQGFFDVAFYSLRQSIELSLDAPYLLANPDKIKEWERMEPGFESGSMAKFLREKEPVFRGMREKMHMFFDNIRNIQLKINKYVHKQGYKYFYVMQRYSWSDNRDIEIYRQISSDFELALRCAIGAVAVYRLSIDPLPILLMDEDIAKRIGDVVTMPYSPRFVDKYLGAETLNAYMQTEMYKDFRSSIEAREKQNEAVFSILHYKIIDRNKIDDITKQLHLLSLYDRLAVAFMISSSKISRIYVECIFLYHSVVKAKDGICNFDSSDYIDSFKTDDNFNLPFKNDSFVSRVKVHKEYSYIESRSPLDKREIALLTYNAKMFHEVFCKAEKRFEKFITSGEPYEYAK